MYERMFDKHSNMYRDLTARIDEDNEKTAGDSIVLDGDVVIDKDGKTYIVGNLDVDYYSVVDGMKDIYAAKNSDYGNSFEMTLDKYGIIAAIIRMQDKMNRIDGYYWKPDEDKKVDESLIDTLEDLGNYAIMTSVWLRNQ